MNLKKGDRVRHKTTGRLGNIKHTRPGKSGIIYVIDWDDHIVGKHYIDFLRLVESSVDPPVQHVEAKPEEGKTTSFYKQDPQCYMCREQIPKDMEQEYKIHQKEYILCVSCVGRLNIHNVRRTAQSEPSYGQTQQLCAYCYKKEHIPTHQYVKVNNTIRHMCSICWDDVRTRFVRSLNERRKS